MHDYSSEYSKQLATWMNHVDQEVALAMSFPTHWGVFFKPERDSVMDTETYYDLLQDQVLSFFSECLKVEQNKVEIQACIDAFEYK